jgi:hypothetical protein
MFLRNPPVARESLLNIFEQEDYAIQFYKGKPINEVPGIERRLLEEELDDEEEEDAEELGLRDIFNADEMEALNYNPEVRIDIPEERQQQQLPDIYEGIFGFGKGRSRRIKFIPGPFDYNYERDDVYGDYRLE